MRTATIWWATFACAGAIVSAAAITQIGIEQQKPPRVEIQYQPYAIAKPVVEKQVQIKTVVKEVVKTVTEIKEVEVPTEVIKYVTDESAMEANYISGYEDGRIEGEDWQALVFGRALRTACVTEDSDNCYWNAQTNGNGSGRSFVIVNGSAYYLD